MTPREIAYSIEGSDAASILLDQPYRSFCNGSDRLEALGLWDHDGLPSDLCHDVRAILLSLAVLS